MSVNRTGNVQKEAVCSKSPAWRTVEQAFWQANGATWKQLAGGIDDSGFSFEWHDWQAAASVQWERSFHGHAIEICLNLEGHAWVEASGQRMAFKRDTSGFFAVGSGGLRAVREGGQRHRFLSVECSIGFIRENVGDGAADLHPVVKRCIDPGGPVPSVSGASAMTHRQRDLLRSLLHPPVLTAAQQLWYRSKAMEFVAEFFFSPNGQGTLCSRAQKLAAERVAKTKELLVAKLDETPSLQEIGRHVGCSPFYLSRTFSRETGLSISQWLRRAKLERAAELLRSGKCNVTQAAVEVGYSSLSHFSQAFHEMFGCCPGLYPVLTPAQRARGLSLNHSLFGDAGGTQS